MQGLHLLLLLICTAYAAPKPKTNHDLLTKLGLERVRPPSSHHRKRLAVESRHSARSDDSHVFVIKLPPNPSYYAPPPNALPTANLNGKRVPVGFKGNGKPAKVYHWNLPTVRKAMGKRKKVKHAADASAWNEVGDKAGAVGAEGLKPVYYVPKAKKYSFTKWFAGNGKPHSFYVIERSKKAHYHRLLP